MAAGAVVTIVMGVPFSSDSAVASPRHHEPLQQADEEVGANAEDRIDDDANDQVGDLEVNGRAANPD